MRSALLVAALLALAGAAPPLRAPPSNAGQTEAAKETPPWARKWLGRWSLYEDGEGGQGCALDFVQGMSIGGAALQLTPTCRQLFPLEDVAGWTLGDPRAKRPRIQFIDALRKPVLTFEPLKDLPWSAALPHRDGLERPQALLERDTEKHAHQTVRQLLKDTAYDLSGPDMKDWCGFELKATGAAAGKLTQAGRCARRWKGKGWASWEFRDGRLLLKGKAGAVLLTLTRGDETTFQGGTEADPLFFGPGAIVMS